MLHGFQSFNHYLGFPLISLRFINVLWGPEMPERQLFPAVDNSGKCPRIHPSHNYVFWTLPGAFSL